MFTNDGLVGKVAFSLAKKKTKGSEMHAKLEFDEEHFRKQEDVGERTSPLVIRLPDCTKQSLLDRKRAISDDAAAHALIESASLHYLGGDSSTTNFDATGDLVISSGASQLIIAKNDAMKESQHFQAELQSLPAELDATSETYRKIPIQEFGAALLRGMGWSGHEEPNAELKGPMIRPHRLGLGATPKMPPTHSKANRLRTETQVKQHEQSAQQQKELEAQQKLRTSMDKQLKLQLGSVVSVQGRRASMLQLLGVPGLNRVLVQMEEDSVATSVRKGDVSLIPRTELDARPFVVKELVTDLKTIFHGESKVSRHYLNQNNHEDSRKANRDKMHHSEGADRRRKDDDRQGDRKRSRSDDDGRSQRAVNFQKKTTIQDTDAMYWVVPNIRVRVITRKLGSEHYTQKGIVIDVTRCGATIHMSSGQVLDKVPECYIETALPKPGGNTIVLAGRHKFAKGKLLQRDSNRGKGVVQVFEDMNVLTLKLDDLAEWCGPLDDNV